MTVANSKARFRIETSPTSGAWTVQAREPLTLAGWYVGAQGKAAEAIEILIGKRRFLARQHKRPDLSGAGEGKISPNEAYGFSANFTVGSGLKYLTAFALVDGQRHCIYRAYFYARNPEGKSLSRARRKIGLGGRDEKGKLLRKEFSDLQKLEKLSLEKLALEEKLAGLSKAIHELIGESGSALTQDWEGTRQRLEALIAAPPASAAQTPTSASEGRLSVLQAKLERVEPNHLYGWICLEAQVGRTNVLVSFDGIETGVIHLDEERRDVGEKLGGYGLGFAVPLPPSLCDGRPHRLLLRPLAGAASAGVEPVFETVFIAEPQLLRTPAPQVTERPTVVFVTHNLRSQGAQNSLFELVVGLQERGRVHPVVVAPGDGELAQSYRDHGVALHVIPCPPRRSHLASVWKRGLLSYSHALEALEPTLILANTLQSFPAILAARIIHCPSVLVIRESEPPETYFDDLPELPRAAAQKVVCAANEVVFVAEATRQLWQAHAARQNHFHTLHNALRVERLAAPVAGTSREAVRMALGLTPEERVVLSLGSVNERKGQEDLIYAVPELLQGCTEPVRIVFVGFSDNPYAKKLRQVVQSWPEALQKQVLMLPEVIGQGELSVADYYLAADIFCFTSRLESYPRVILEAMYFGLPIVSTPCFGVLEQCEEGGNALYYQAGDIEGLRNQLAQLLQNSEKRKQFGARSRSLFQKMTPYPELLECYEKLFSKHLNSAL